MHVEREGAVVRITLGEREVTLLRYALERASLIDTPAAEQGAIANFCGRALEALAPVRP